MTKAALYGNFGSKDQLVVAYLRERDRRWQQQIDRLNAEHDRPRDRVLAVFDAYEDWLSRDGFRGCAFLNATAEFPDRDHPAREVVRHHKTALRSYLQAQVRRIRPDRPDVLADQLMILLEGPRRHPRSNRTRSRSGRPSSSPNPCSRCSRRTGPS